MIYKHGGYPCYTQSASSFYLLLALLHCSSGKSLHQFICNDMKSSDFNTHDQTEVDVKYIQ